LSSGPYRRDIDGLRGIAVLAVLLYHYEIGPLCGGFVGVDIFFVISGYLITGIIQREIAEGTFTYAAFYERRVRRLFPALFVMLPVTLAVGLGLLLPSDLRALGTSGVATLSFWSNVLFWRSSGYFEAGAELNPLLHTWSLSVEEQFYIGLPILLLLVSRFARRWLGPVLVLTAVVSLAACVGFQLHRPTATFFLAPFRAWELMLGALLATGFAPRLRRRAAREGTAALALFALLGSVAYIEPGVTFPGWRAIVPAVATAALLLTGGSGETVVGRLLCVRPLAFVGAISYSLYLWHWPLVVFARYRSGFEPLGNAKWPLVVLALGVSALSYRFVEQPFRRRTPGSASGPVLRWGAAAMALLAGASLLPRLHDGWVERFPSTVVALDRERQPVIPFLGCIDQPLASIRRREVCSVGAQGVAPTALVWGDSHALAWLPALDDLFREQGISALFAGRSACPPLADVVNPANSTCLEHNREIAAFLREQRGLRLVVMAASWLSYSVAGGQYQIEDVRGTVGNDRVFAPALRATMRQLRDDGRSVWILGPVPGAPSDVPLRMALAAVAGRDPAGVAPKSTAPFLAQAASFYGACAALSPDPDVVLTNPTSWLCDDDSCRYQEGGLPIYRDAGHLNIRGAAAVRPHLSRAFSAAREQLLGSRASSR
jgi:peptidoglycan/LPS O-acetylase OafA/YrhL